MSAFMVSKAHIDYLVEAAMSLPHRQIQNASGLYWHHDDESHQLPCTGDGPDGAERVGAMLWAENRASVNSRYDEDQLEPVYTRTIRPATVEPVQVLKALDCYKYQSCEHDGWPESEAHAFCDALRHCAIGCLPGYEEAAWDIDELPVVPHYGDVSFR